MVVWRTLQIPSIHISLDPGLQGVPSVAISFSMSEKNASFGLQCSWHGVSETSFKSANSIGLLICILF